MTRNSRPGSVLVTAAVAGAVALAAGTLSACSGDATDSHASAHATAPTSTQMPSSATASGATASETTASGTTAPTGSASSASASRAGDVMFAQMMIPHHEQAVEMADLALTKPGVSAQVRDLATQIKQAQGPEIATMRGWLASWGAPTAAPTAMGHEHADGMMSAKEMTQLEASTGADFDRRWLTMMIAHHEGAVTMAEQVLSTTQDPQVKKLAQSIISGQKAEIATMRGLL